MAASHMTPTLKLRNTKLKQMHACVRAYGETDHVEGKIRTRMFFFFKQSKVSH